METAKHPPLIDFTLRIETDAFVRSPVWMIGPQSYFSDSAVPLVDVIAVPARHMKAESLLLTGHTAPRLTRNYLRRREKALQPLSANKPESGGTDAYYVDLRPFGLSNWSHSLNKAIPLAVMVRDHLASIHQPTPRFILNAHMSQKIMALFDSFGLDYINTDKIVQAPLIEVEMSNKSLIDMKSRAFIASIEDDINRLIASVPHIDYEKVFINRKPPSRSLLNNDAIKGTLEQLGYREIFLEDHNVAEQIAILANASDIFAIHGAGLAPLMFRNAGHGPFRFIEVSTPGHIVPFFRDMVGSLACTYRMIRGVPDPAMSSDAFVNLDPPSLQFKKNHASTPFRLDPASLHFALDSLNDAGFPMQTIETPL